MSPSNRFQLMVAALLFIFQASGLASDAELSSECDSMNPPLEGDSGDSMLQFKRGAMVQTLSVKAVQTEDEHGPSPDSLKRMQASFDKYMKKTWLSHAPARQLVNGKSSDWLNGECDITPLGQEIAGPCPPNAPDCIFLSSTNTHIVPNKPCKWTSPCNTKTLGGACKCTGTPLTTTKSSYCLGTCKEGCGVAWQDRSSDTCYTYASIEACNPTILTSDDSKLSAAQPVGVPTSLLEDNEDGPSPDSLKRMQASFDRYMKKTWLSHAPARQLVNGKSSDWLNGECAITPLGQEIAGPCPPNAPDCIFLSSTNTHIVPNKPCKWTSPCNTKTLGGACKCTGTPLTTTKSSYCLGTCKEGCGVAWQNRSSDTCYTYASIEACNPTIFTSDDAKLSAAQPVGVPTSLLEENEAEATIPAAAQGDMFSVPSKPIANGAISELEPVNGTINEFEASSPEESFPMNGAISELEANCPRYNCGSAHFYSCCIKPKGWTRYHYPSQWVQLWGCGGAWNWHNCEQQCVANLPSRIRSARNHRVTGFMGLGGLEIKIWCTDPPTPSPPPPTPQTLSYVMSRRRGVKGKIESAPSPSPQYQQEGQQRQQEQPQQPQQHPRFPMMES